MKSFIRLATCCDPYLERFIYRDCTYLWREIDLKHYPGITDTQLESLLRRINAQSVTQSIILDKNTRKPITGAGLEPLRYSKVLESVDLRQTTTIERGPTGLHDRHVARILKTMVSYKLETVKVRRQHAGRGFGLFDEYWAPWRTIFASLRFKQARACQHKACSHCSSPMAPYYQDATKEEILTREAPQCSVCNGCSCGIFSPDYPWGECNVNRQCDHCHDWCCTQCRQVMTCSFCGVQKSCSDCNMILQCSICSTTGCRTCDAVFECKCCSQDVCEGCGLIWCMSCGKGSCLECDDVIICAFCSDGACVDCRKCNRRACSVFLPCLWRRFLRSLLQDLYIPSSQACDMLLLQTSILLS